MTLNPMLRMACRVCLQLGIDDPEQWLHSRPQRVIYTWAAYWRLEPWGLPWHRHAAWMCGLDRVINVLLGWATGGKSDFEPRKFAEWMPDDWAGSAPQRRSRATLQKQLSVLRAAHAGNGWSVAIINDND